MALSSVRLCNSASHICDYQSALRCSISIRVVIARRKHPFPYRTRQLSSSAAEVVGPQGPARYAHCPDRELLNGPTEKWGRFFIWFMAGVRASSPDDAETSEAVVSPQQPGSQVAGDGSPRSPPSKNAGIGPFDSCRGFESTTIEVCIS